MLLMWPTPRPVAGLAVLRDVGVDGGREGGGGVSRWRRGTIVTIIFFL